MEDTIGYRLRTVLRQAACRQDLFRVQADLCSLGCVLTATVLSLSVTKKLDAEFGCHSEPPEGLTDEHREEGIAQPP